jgi:hypothetical protein
MCWYKPYHHLRPWPKLAVSSSSPPRSNGAPVCNCRGFCFQWVVWVLHIAKRSACQVRRVDRSDGWPERSSNLDSKLDDEKIIVAQGANTCERGELNRSTTSAAIGIVEQLAIGGIEDQVIVRVLGASRLVDA